MKSILLDIQVFSFNSAHWVATKPLTLYLINERSLLKKRIIKSYDTSFVKHFHAQKILNDINTLLYLLKHVTRSSQTHTF